MRVKELNQEVLVADDKIGKVKRQDIEIMKKRAVNNQRRRIRLCAHSNVDDTLHEMLIVLAKSTYIRPHKHLGKSESLHAIEGIVDVVVFDENGNITEVIQIGDYPSGRSFYYRMSAPYYHTLLIRSDFLVFHETTNGPFKRSDTIFAPWAPDESDTTAGKAFMEELSRSVESFTPNVQNGP